MLGVALSGCKEDFLELYPTTEIDENAAFSTQDNAMAVLYGIYDGITDATCGFLHLTLHGRPVVQIQGGPGDTGMSFTV